MAARHLPYGRENASPASVRVPGAIECERLLARAVVMNCLQVETPRRSKSFPELSLNNLETVSDGAAVHRLLSWF